ncbi:hypothetical protein JTB14_015676 [Gonioctena quinquepunctata]|nr:hypothetical protein JTB14_015676 [Gonioctena quinquepunctata]
MMIIGNCSKQHTKADIRSISVINMRLSLLEYMRYIGGTHSSRCVYEGEEVLNAGHVILCGKLNSSTSEKLNLCADANTFRLF